MKNRKKTFNDNVKTDEEPAFDDVDENTNKIPWYEEIAKDPDAYDHADEALITTLRSEAKICLDNETINYNTKNSKKNNDYQWMKTMMNKGTIADRIAACTVIIQDNPVCNLEAIRHLVSMVKAGKKNDCIQVVDALTDLFIENLLVAYRKLKLFRNRPLKLLGELSSGNAFTRRKLLSYWYFEDQLKETYASYVEALSVLSRDSVENNKEKAVKGLYKLLNGNPEQDKKLLNLLVNKLGDPSRKVASKVIYCLTQLLNNTPSMQIVVLNEIEHLLFRANIAPRAQYYSLCFLTQFYLNNDEPRIARSLIELYFAFFKACVKKGDVDSRMMGALLVGTKRAFPYAKLQVEKIAEHIDTLYKIVHIANFNVAVHALALLYQVSDFSNNINDRFYSALYKKLLEPQIANSNHQAMLLNLTFKALKKDRYINRSRVFVKRLLQLALSVLPAMACGILFMVSQLLHNNPSVAMLKGHETSLSERTAQVCVDDTISSETPLLNIEIKQEDEVEDKKNIQFNSVYDACHRNPRYGGGEYCAYYELCVLRRHFHPSVALFAQHILRGERISYSGDPLKDFTLIRFLDRFAFKNPKRLTGGEKGSGSGAHPIFGKRKRYAPRGVRSVHVNSMTYVNAAEKSVPVDELFLYKFLKNKMANVRVKDEPDSDADSVADDEFEEMLNQMSGNWKDANEVDYMEEIGDSFKKSKNDESAEERRESEEEEDDDDGDGEEDEEIEREETSDVEDNSDDDIMGLSDEDDDASDIEFSSDDDNDEAPTAKRRKHQKKGDANSVFASAEEFSTLLEEEASSSKAAGGLHAMANKDKADLKQINWEEKRNQWVQGYNKFVGKKGKFSKRGTQPGKIQKPSNTANRKKKTKK